MSDGQRPLSDTVLTTTLWADSLVVSQFGRMWSGHSVTGLLELPMTIVLAASSQSGHGVTGPQLRHYRFIWPFGDSRPFVFIAPKYLDVWAATWPKPLGAEGSRTTMWQGRLAVLWVAT